jgi:cytosolic phospholipase A2
MDEPPSRRVKSEEDETHLMSPEAGITLIYYPFLANKKVPGVDPTTSDFMSTWNFVYTPEEIDKVVALARANFEEGREQTRRTIRAVWERKRKLRLQREQKEREMRHRYRMRHFTNEEDSNLDMSTES